MKLEKWMEIEDLKPQDVADRIGCDRSTIVRLLPGKDGQPPTRRPGWELSRKIEALTDGKVTRLDFADNDQPPPASSAPSGAAL